MRRLTNDTLREIRRLVASLIGARNFGLTLIRTNGVLTAYMDSTLNNGPYG